MDTIGNHSSGRRIKGLSSDISFDLDGGDGNIKYKSLTEKVKSKKIKYFFHCQICNYIDHGKASPPIYNKRTSFFMKHKSGITNKKCFSESRCNTDTGLLGPIYYTVIFETSK